VELEFKRLASPLVPLLKKGEFFLVKSPFGKGGLRGILEIQLEKVGSLLSKIPLVEVNYE